MAVTITLGATGVTNVGKGGDAAGDKFVNFENITGGLAADVLTGNADANLLTGGAGNDVLTGGLGADRFQFNATTHGVDVIKDFVFGTDTIGLDGDAFGVPLAGSAQSLGINFVHGSVPTGPGYTLLYDATGPPAVGYRRHGRGAGRGAGGTAGTPDPDGQRYLLYLRGAFALRMRPSGRCAWA
jgi:hypothetical protein